MRLYEALGAPQPINWIKDGNNYIGDFSAGGSNYKMRIELANRRFGVMNHTIANIAFQRIDQNNTPQITLPSNRNTPKPGDVFATVVNGSIDILKQLPNVTIIIAAVEQEAAETSRKSPADIQNQRMRIYKNMLVEIRHALSNQFEQIIPDVHITGGHIASFLIHKNLPQDQINHLVKLAVNKW